MSDKNQQENIMSKSKIKKSSKKLEINDQNLDCTISYNYKGAQKAPPKVSIVKGGSAHESTGCTNFISTLVTHYTKGE